MMEFLRKMLSNDPSVSETRFMALIVLVVGIICTGVAVVRLCLYGMDITTGWVTLILGIFGLAVGGKAVQNLAGRAGNAP